jgi:hypothetical protein
VERLLVVRVAPTRADRLRVRERADVAATDVQPLADRVRSRSSRVTVVAARATAEALLVG